MKKAKIMLGALVALVMISSSLAFKAKRSYIGTIFTSTDGVALCTNPTPLFTIEAGGPTTFASITKDAACPTRVSTVFDLN